MKLISLTALVFALLCVGCVDQTKRLTLAEDGVTTTATAIDLAYRHGAINQAQVRSVTPYVDAAEAACIEAEKHTGESDFAQAVDAAVAAYQNLSAHDIAKKAKAQ